MVLVCVSVSAANSLLFKGLFISPALNTALLSLYLKPAKNALYVSELSVKGNICVGSDDFEMSAYLIQITWHFL